MPQISSTSNPSNQLAKIFEGKPITNGKITYKAHDSKTTNRCFSSVLDDLKNGANLKQLNEKLLDAGHGKKTLEELKAIDQTLAQNNSQIGPTVAFLFPQATLTKAAMKVIQGNAQNNSQEVKKEAPKDAAKIPDKVARIITLVKETHKDYANAISEGQVTDISTGLTADKPQLNEMKGWDGAVDALKGVIDHLENVVITKGCDNNKLLQQLAETKETYHTLEETIDGLKQQIAGAPSDLERQQLHDKVNELGLKVITLQSNLSKELGNIEDLNAHIGGLNHDISALNRKIGEHEDIIAGLNSDKADLEQQLSHARDIGDSGTVKALESEIAELEKNIALRHEEIDDLQGKLETQTEENKQLADDISNLERKLSDALKKKDSSSKHTAELIAGIVALVAATTLFLVALLPKDDSSEETTTNSVDTTELKSELQSEATELQAQIAQDDATLAKLDDAQATLADVSDAIEAQEDALVQQESDKIKEAGDKAYKQALDEAKAAAYEIPANQAFEVNEYGQFVPSGELTEKAEAECEAQATSARETAEAQEKQSIDAQLQKAGQLDSQIQVAGSKAAATAQQIAADRIATQTQLDGINNLIGQIPDEFTYTTQNIENTNNGLSDAGFYTTLATASVLAAGGIGLLFKFGLGSHKRRENVEMKDAQTSTEVPLMQDSATEMNVTSTEEQKTFDIFDDMLRTSTTPAFYENNLYTQKAF